MAGIASHRADAATIAATQAIDARRSLPIVYLIYLAFQVDPEEIGAGGIGTRSGGVPSSGAGGREGPHVGDSQVGRRRRDRPSEPR